MDVDFALPDSALVDALRRGLAIPAHPLALDSRRRYDQRHQRALTRYYHAAGAGGVAVAVHTTQFEIRDPRYGLLEPVLRDAAETARECDSATGRRTVLIAGVVGETRQAVHEAELSQALGYHAVLLSLASMRGSDIERLLSHCREVARVMPVVGFYLQPAVGGLDLPEEFWRRLSELPNLVAIKIAPFNRYRTLDVLRGVAASSRAGEIALYTGNDDSIVNDLLTTWRPSTDARPLRIVGGLLGHWACWTRRAVELHSRCLEATASGIVPADLLELGARVTDCNAAFFDPSHGFRGAIAGVNEVLRRQGLMESAHCLDPESVLSPGQSEAIDRVWRAYPELNDDEFVGENLEGWLA